MVEITDTARDKLKEILNENEGKYLRILLQGVGWGGPRLGMVLDEPDKNEQPLSINGIDVLIDEYERSFTDGTVIDYVKQANGEGFVINNSCSGC